jgi:CheY-like chemotaxis protein
VRMKDVLGDGVFAPAALNVLLVEDDPGDALMVREALAEGELPVQVHVVNDGDQALRFLRHQGEHAEAPRPGLILLDLNLPGLDGRDLLIELKNDENLRLIPVVVWSSSLAEQDVTGSYQSHANAYISKPLEAVGFAEVVRRVQEFFTLVVKLPQ